MAPTGSNLTVSRRKSNELKSGLAPLRGIFDGGSDGDRHRALRKNGEIASVAKCANCGKGNDGTELKRCTGFKTVYFCGKECQKMQIVRSRESCWF